MTDEEHYQDAVRRLAKHDYVVTANHQSGYIVQCLTAADDMSNMRNLDELVEFADLMDWAEHRHKMR
jgi:hypothetical protein